MRHTTISVADGRADERAYWSCRLGIPEKVLEDALRVDDLGPEPAPEIERLTPFSIGRTNFLMIDRTQGHIDCRLFSIVAQSSGGWREVWELPEDQTNDHCGLVGSPRIRVKRKGFSFRLPRSAVRDRDPIEFPSETWAYRWTGKSFKLVHAPSSYRAPKN
jgi:hypothetical protein